MNWQLSHRADVRPLDIADRHYSRQKPGSPQFVKPGRCCVLYTSGAYWTTSWPFAEWTKHAWAGEWECSAFRNESSGVLSSLLIRDALAVTRWFWPDDQPSGMVTFVDEAKTRKKRDPGRCYRKAGFEPCGYTKGGLFALWIPVADMPAAEPPVGYGSQLSLVGPTPHEGEAT